MFRNRLSHRSTKAPRRRNALAIEGLEDRTVLSASRTLGGLEFVTPGEFTTEGTQVRATGSVQVGVDQPGDTFIPLVQFTDGVSFTDGDPSGLFTGNGEMIGIIGGQSIPLAGSAIRELSAAGLLDGIDLGGGKSLSVAGANFNLSGIDLDGDAVKLQGSLGLPQLAGLNIAVENDDYVIISPGGVSLTGLDASIGEVSFQRAGFGFNLNEAHVHYSNSDNSFAISGDGSILMAGREVGIRLGGDGVDGIVIQDGQLTDVNATVTAPQITVGGASLRPSGLTLEYSTANDTFAITGAAELAVGGATFGVELGDIEQGTKGLVLAGGELQGLDMAVTADFAVGGITFTADRLRIAYTPADERFVLTGAAGASVLGNSVNVRFGGDGAEGIVIEAGQLTRLDATVSGSLGVGGLSFASDGLHLVYTPGDNTFELTGTASATMATAELGLALGGDDTPGLRIVDGKLESLDVAVTGGFRVGGMAFQAQDLRLAYSKVDNSFRITGTASATFARSTMSVTFSQDGGIVIEDGQLTHLDAAINGKFMVGGMTIDAENLGMSYDAEDERYSVFGGAFVTSPGGRVLNHVGARLGTGIDDPGLVIWQGEVQELDIGIDGKVTVGGMSLEAKDLTLRYDVPTGKMQLVGGLGLSLAANKITAAATLTGDGFTFDPDTGEAKVHGLKFQASADFKSVKVNNVVVEYANDGQSTVWAASGSVQLAPGVEIGGDFRIENGKLTRIGLSYDAGTGLGILIPGTGQLYVTRVAGVIDNLDSPTDIRVAVQAEVTYGRTVRFMGKEYSLFRATGDIEVSKDYLKIRGDIKLCNGLMGAGSATVDLNWAQGRYTVGYDVLMYYGTFHQVGELVLDGTAVSFDGTATLQAPQAIKKELEQFGLPTEYAGAAFRLRIDPTKSAAWNYAEATFKAVNGLTVSVRYDFDGKLNLWIMNGVLRKLTKALDAAGHAVTQAYDGANKLTQTVKETLNDAGVVVYRETFAGAKRVIEAFNNRAELLTRQTIDGVKTVTETFTNGGTQLAKKVTETAGQVVTEMFAFRRGAHRKISQVTERAFEKVTELYNDAEKVATRIYEEAGHVFTDTLDAAGNTVNRVTQFGAEVTTEFWYATYHTLERIQGDGVKYVAKTIYATGQQVQTWSRNGEAYLRLTLKNGSEEVRETWDTGYAAGRAGARYVKREITARGAAIWTTATRGANTVRDTFESTGRRIKETWDNAGHYKKQIKEAGSNTWRTVENSFEDAGDAIVDTAEKTGDFFSGAFS